MFGKLVSTAAVAAATLATSCTPGTAPINSHPSTTDAVVRSVVPAGGATGVDPEAPITVVFSHAMPLGAATLVMLHEGSVTGPQVLGTAAWSTDLTQLTFTPSAPLKSHTTYVLHFSPNLVDADGNPIDWGRCAGPLGGQSVPSGAFHGGMMGGGMGPWMNGPGWQPGNGTWGYGMIVTFTTA